jgi:tRNA wybutosine-synthesizing protein 2
VSARTRPLPPAERVRALVASEFGTELAAGLPTGYQRLGSVLLLDLPDAARPAFASIGQAWQATLGVRTVLRRAGPIEGTWRRPAVERLAGDSSETTVVEHGVRFRFDAARLMFARGNRTERHRFGTLVRPGETVTDLFAGIGYFTLPALVTGRADRVWAVEQNPLAFRYLVENIAAHRAADRARPILGDNRRVELPAGGSDRVVLGYLPSSLPWLPRALPLLRPDGGWLHVHLVGDAREGPSGAAREVAGAIARAGGRGGALSARLVKPYGPGRGHYVVDAWARPPPTDRA